MKRRSIETTLAMFMTVACLGVTGCTGILQPTIGESGIASADTAAAGENGTEMGPGEGGDMEGPGFGGGPGQEEEEPKPEMTGEVKTRFATSKEVSNGLGQKMTLTATIELYDAENADGYNALIDVKLGEREKFTPCTWKEENGSYTLSIDEFTDYESKEINGVLMVVGVRYEFGMDGKGTIDVPIEGSDSVLTTETMENVEDIAPETETAEETTEAM